MPEIQRSQGLLPGPLAFEPVKHPSLGEAVVTALRRAIVDGKLRPGERLLEVDLSAQFGVSRAVTRQALQQLNFDGLVEIRPRRGAVVTRMSSAVARDVCTVRGVLEGWAARRACQTLGEDSLRRMRAIADEMGARVRAGDAYSVVTLDIEYHALICRGDPNARLFAQWSSLNASHAALMASRLAYHNYNPVAVTSLHAELCDVLAARDPDEAERAVRLHYMGLRWAGDDDGEGSEGEG